MRLLQETHTSNYFISVVNQKRGSTNDQYEELFILTVNEKCKLEQIYDSIFHYHRIGKDSKEW